MGKKRKRPPKSGPVWHVSALEATRLSDPRYNGWVCGAGVHGDVKYNRAREKRQWTREVSEKGLPFRWGLIRWRSKRSTPGLPIRWRHD